MKPTAVKGKYMLSVLIALTWAGIATPAAPLKEGKGAPSREATVEGTQQLGGNYIAVRVAFHLVRHTNGSGPTASPSAIATMFDEVNNLFAPSGIVFISTSTDYIDNDALYSPSTLAGVDVLRSTNVVPNTINVYYCDLSVNRLSLDDRLTGISSFSFDPVQGIVLTYACDAKSGALAHMLGHYLDVFPIFETRFGLECADGSNCTIAGDLLCDTPACPDGAFPDVQCRYLGGFTDPCGQPYFPDIYNVMGAWWLDCRNHLTAGQLQRAKDALSGPRANHVLAYISCPQAVYVDGAAPPEGNGTWRHPYQTMPQGLTSTCGPGGLVVVGPGIYPAPLAIHTAVIVISQGPVTINK